MSLVEIRPSLDPVYAPPRVSKPPRFPPSGPPIPGRVLVRLGYAPKETLSKLSERGFAVVELQVATKGIDVLHPQGRERVVDPVEASLGPLRLRFGDGNLARDELHAFEPKVGGKVDLSVEIDAKRRHYGGLVLIYESEREVSFEVQWEPPHSWPVPTFWTIRLTPAYGGTLVELFHHGFERLGSEAADNLQGYEEGWDVQHLKALRSIAEQ